MSNPALSPPKVKLFCSIIYKDDDAKLSSLSRLERQFGEIDFVSPAYLFEDSPYYHQEMGSPLYRVFASFKVPIDNDMLPEAKINSFRIEEELSVDKKRMANLDVGYIDYKRLVLASFKEQRNKLYLKDGVWADMIAWVESKKLKYLDWTFTDYRSGIYDKALLEIRRIFKEQMKNGHKK